MQLIPSIQKRAISGAIIIRTLIQFLSLEVWPVKEYFAFSPTRAKLIDVIVFNAKVNKQKAFAQIYPPNLDQNFLHLSKCYTSMVQL